MKKKDTPFVINPKNLYTKSAYCKKVGITRATLDRWIKKDKVTYWKIQGGWIIYYDET